MRYLIKLFTFIFQVDSIVVNEFRVMLSHYGGSRASLYNFYYSTQTVNGKPNWKSIRYYSTPNHPSGDSISYFWTQHGARGLEKAKERLKHFDSIEKVESFHRGQKAKEFKANQEMMTFRNSNAYVSREQKLQEIYDKRVANQYSEEIQLF